MLIHQKQLENEHSTKKPKSFVTTSTIYSIKLDLLGFLLRTMHRLIYKFHNIDSVQNSPTLVVY